MNDAGPIDHAAIGARAVAAVGVAGARDLLETLSGTEGDRAALIGRLHLRNDGARLAELLFNLEEDEPARLHLLVALKTVANRRRNDDDT